MLRQLTLAKGWKQDRNLCSQEKSRLPGKCFLLRSLTNQNKHFVPAAAYIRQKTPPDSMVLVFWLFPSISQYWCTSSSSVILCGLSFLLFCQSRTRCVQKLTEKHKNFSHSPYWLWVSSDCEPDGVVIQTHQVTSYCMLRAGSGDRSDVHRGFMN